MTKDEISRQSTSSLLSGIYDGDASNDYIYEATEALLKRWRKGIDLTFIENLLISESSGSRLRGAYYLSELGQEVEVLNTVALQLADDVISACRKAFVEYTTSSWVYNDAFATALAKCLSDLDLYVRVSVIEWGVNTSQERFEDFVRLVEAGAGGPVPRFRNPRSNDFWNEAALRRAVRGTNIIRRVRDGEGIQQIRKDITEEDSFVFDSLDFSRTTRERLAKWRERPRPAS